ncbi:inositol monophosphatase [Clostridium sp. D2Q-14]|uniref:inositol monophosphatase family protein n=1 Tax=Anaeromonas gelatinilytica TaxID=2683194 RepID=UPI00193BB55D|nr:inositol monophosphatase family protein [Anaeromonas gelatinilytica]MBS4534062.1 inositol monophosphatase [Anaeromonas gelatinilytica]
MIDLNKAMEEVKSWAIKAGKIQKENYEKENLKINTKSSDIDLVTEVDELSEKIILSAIKENYSDHGILSEESDYIEKNSDYLWIVDPLDGTNNYAQGLPIFAVSIALKFKGEIVLGVVYEPILNEMFSAIKGKGAYLNDKKITVGSKNTLRQSVLATGFPYDRVTNIDNNLNYLNSILPKLRGIRRMGAAAYDLANVACGRLDGYWELRLSPWDVAAGRILIKEAGGKVIDIPNKRKVSIVAGNSQICDLIMGEIKLLEEK